MFHITQPQSTSHTIPHPQLFHTTPTFNITAYFTPHHIPHRITPQNLDFTSHHYVWHHNTWHHFPHCTSHNNHTAHCICHSLHHYNTTPPHSTSHRNWLSASCIMQHSTHQDTTFHTMPYSTSHILHFHHTVSEIATFHITPHFTYISHHISHRTVIHIKSLHHTSLGTPFYITPTFHLTPRQAH